MPLPTHCVILPRPPDAKNKFSRKNFFKKKNLKKNFKKIFFLFFHSKLFTKKFQIASWMRKNYFCIKKIVPGGWKMEGRRETFFFQENNHNWNDSEIYWLALKIHVITFFLVSNWGSFAIWFSSRPREGHCVPQPNLIFWKMKS